MKTERFKQANPKDQMQVVLMGLEGHLDNWRNRIISDPMFALMVTEFIKDCKSLQPHLSDEWVEPLCPNCDDQGCDYCGPEESETDAREAFDERF